MLAIAITMVLAACALGVVVALTILTVGEHRAKRRMFSLALEGNKQNRMYKYFSTVGATALDNLFGTI